MSRRMLAALIVSSAFAVVSAVPAQQTLGLTRLTRGSAPVLWLRADQGFEAGIGNIASRWSEAGGGPLDVSQTDGSRMPLLERHLVDGRPAVHFDGNDMLSRTDGMPTGDYTKVAVVVLDDYASNNNVLSGATEHALFYGGTDRAQMYHSGTFVTSSVPTPLGEPTVLVATYDAGTGEGRLYQNGQLVGTGVAPANTDTTIQVGAFAGSNFLHGSIPELRVYDRVLTRNERSWLEAVLGNRYRSGRAPEVSFTKLPLHGQILQRDGADMATVMIEGTVDTPGYDEIEVEIFQDDVSWFTDSSPLAYAGTTASFSFAPSIVAGLHDYDISLTLLRGTRRTEVRRVERIACGDTFVVNGQSNAMAADFGGEGLGNQSQSPWIRSFGTSSTSEDLDLDLHWDTADGELANAHATVGSWALRMAEILVQQEQIPIGLLNGAIGGTAIVTHLRNDAFPTDPTTVYGRLLYRAQIAGIADGARALFWYQGESDGEEVATYTTDFDILYNAWHQDYPALEKIYVFQIRKGCGVTGPGVREFHRTTADIYPDIEVMSTTAAPSHNGCHFLYVGYMELADRISRVVERDLYGSLNTQQIDPPNIFKAEFVGSNNDQILLTFRDLDDVLVWEAGSEAFFYLDDPATVVSGSVTANTILLQLSGTSAATKISYDGHEGDGPWVRNARGVGALTFFDFTVDP